MLLTLTLFASVSFASSCYDPKSLDIPYPQKSKRSPQFSDDSSFGPSPITIDLPPQFLPPQFLPPPWSPDSDVDSPYPSSGVSPWDDSGRSQMIDNEPSVQRTCPKKHLDCRKCPSDVRCRRTMSGGAMGTIAKVTPEDDGNSNCPISKCDTMKSTDCGANAICMRGYCICELGMKSAGVAVRGTHGLGVITVYVDPRVSCNARCDDLTCREVEQLSVGMCYQNGNASLDTVEDEDWKMEDPGKVISSGSVKGKRVIRSRMRDML